MKVREKIQRLRSLLTNLRPTDVFLRSGRLWITLSAIPLAAEVCLSILLWDWLTTEGESASTTIRNIGLVMAGTIALP